MCQTQRAHPVRAHPRLHVGQDLVLARLAVMTGEMDLRTPMGQAEEYYQALRILGVPTVLVRFQGEWHGTSSKPSNFLRTQLYIRKWFEKYGTHDDRRPVSDSDARSR